MKDIFSRPVVLYLIFWVGAAVTAYHLKGSVDAFITAFFGLLFMRTGIALMEGPASVTKD
ncbi:hypothetical protein LT708_25120 [Pseudomonas syringae pv. syringae]|uniref:hypothetical protein n=1 Tax=Pseudomonas syringae TaxID=317 RepID=UPI002009E0C7|nr:hypothetical protein [Pseudomonas syringae]MCK9759876.1 hypothetical protein [Pseudomonas syringae pv. syringae]MCK9774867.1 hypothetical protein [Pseudomonas syringae pv. syringae]